MPTDHEWQRQLADLSDAVYDPQQQTVGDWTRLTDAEVDAAGIDPDLLIDDDSGLKSGLYKNSHGDIVGTEARQAGWAGFKGHSAPKSPTNEGRELNHATQTMARLAMAGARLYGGGPRGLQGFRIEHHRRQHD